MSSFGPFGGARTLVRVIGRAAMVQAYEVALMASVAAMAPLHLVGGGFGPAFGPRSPVQAHTAPRRAPCCSCTASGARSQAGPCSPET